MSLTHLQFVSSLSGVNSLCQISFLSTPLTPGRVRSTSHVLGKSLNLSALFERKENGGQSQRIERAAEQDVCFGEWSRMADRIYQDVGAEQPEEGR